MNNIIKIAVVGDGPIGNLVISKLLIEHFRNNKNQNQIQITHLTSERVVSKGYTRRHILFITQELVEELEKNVLDCDECLKNIANEQILTEDNEGIKLLYSTRLLEQTLLSNIGTNSPKFCIEANKCVFESKTNTAQTYNEYNYVFFAIGSNAATQREEYFFSGNKAESVKIISPGAEPVVIFYSELGTPAENISEEKMLEDKESKIQIINGIELEENGINIFELEKFVTIIYNFYDKMQIFIDRYIYRTVERNIKTKEIIKTQHFIDFEKKPTNNNIIFKNLPEKIQNQIQVSYGSSVKVNVSLSGYNDFDSFIGKFINAIDILHRFFNLEQDDFNDYRNQLYEAYINFLISEKMRPSIDEESKIWYQIIITKDPSIMELLTKYIEFIHKNLKKNQDIKALCPIKIKLDTNKIEYDTNFVSILEQLPKEYSTNNECLGYSFLVNIVPQSLDSFGIYDNNTLAYAAKKNNTNFFMIGDMANAYPAGISVEIGINFVNYIIPMFYNFYINKEKTILNCEDLNIVEILDDLLSDKYASLLDYKTSIKISKSNITLKRLIENIKQNYNVNLNKLCDDNDIFLTYYNIVLLIQFIKNADLINKNKKIIGISKVFKPSNYKIIDTEKIIRLEDLFKGKLKVN
jgi:hypothetical protein